MLGVRTGLFRTLLVSLVSLLAMDALINYLFDETSIGQLAERRPAQTALFFALITLWSFAASAAVLVGVVQMYYRPD